MVKQDARVTVLIPKAFKKELFSRAKKSNRSVGDITRAALTEYFAKEDSNGKPT